MSRPEIAGGIQISEHELLTMTADLEEMHRDSIPRFQRALAQMTEEVGEHLSRIRAGVHRDATRRNFLRGGLVTAGVLGGGMVITACGSSSSATPATSPEGEATDLQVARLATSLEVLAVTTYDAALKAATSGALGAVPPAIATFATTVKGQHGEHRDNWNTVLTKNGWPAQTDPDPKLNGMVQDSLGKVKTVADVANLALTLENVALQTYTAGAPLVMDKSARLIALTIAPVEAQHAAILNFVLGNYPVPDVQIKNDQARTPDDLKA
jgi:hypothetical protein